MKTFAALVSAACVLALVGTAAAQQTTPRQRSTASDRTDDDARRAREARPAWQPEGAAMTSSDIVGTKIRNAQGKDVGKIDQLIVDPQSGRVTHAVVAMGGVLGVGGHKVVVPWSDVRLTAAGEDGKKPTATMDESVLDQAPRYAGIRGATPAASPSTTPRSSNGAPSGTSR
jgi:sporulation protein YlmC with PRC-barrel domain